MDRPINWGQSQVRTFDMAAGYHDILIALSAQTAAVLGQTNAVFSGFTAAQTSPPSLTINLASGSIYQLDPADATPIGAIPQDLTSILQQGFGAAQAITLTTAGILTGQSRWSLIEAQFSQVDVIRAGDPTGGLLFFYNAASPNQPYEGPGNDGQTTPTEREGLVTIQVITGAAATTGSEVPPSPTTGWTPLYLIDLSFGQTTITNGEIIAAGPSVGTGVPNNYPYAPFLAGLLNSHHNGQPGQAPQIKLASEVQGVLPLANMYASSAMTGTGVPVMKLYGGNPNSHVAGNANVNGTSDLCYDTLDGFLYVCTTTGSASTAVWTNLSTGSTANFNGGTSAGTANAQTIAATTPSGFALTAGNTVTFIAGFTNTGATTLNVDGSGVIAVQKLSGGSLVPLTGSEITAGGVAVVTYTGSVWELQASGLGTAAFQNVSFFYQVANVLSEIPAAGAVGTAQGNLQLLALSTGGSGNAYTLTYSPGPSALVTGQQYRGIANFTNTGAATLNINALGAKNILKPGLTPLIAGDIVSGQAIDVTYDGTQFQLISAPATTRIRLGGNLTLYVSTTGSDTANNGLTSGSPWQTIQHAINIVSFNYDLAGFTVTIQLADGTTYNSFQASAPLVGGNAQNLVINGNSGTPSNVQINSSSSCVVATLGGTFTIQNMKLTCSGSSSNCINTSGSGVVIMGAGIVFGSAVNAHMYAAGSGNSLIIITANYSIVGAAPIHMNAASNGSSITVNGSVTVTMSGSLNFSSAFAAAGILAELFVPNMTFTGGTITGVRYLASINGVITTNGGGANYFPGNSPGSISNGGVYV